MSNTSRHRAMSENAGQVLPIYSHWWGKPRTIHLCISWAIFVFHDRIGQNGHPVFWLSAKNHTNGQRLWIYLFLKNKAASPVWPILPRKGHPPPTHSPKDTEAQGESGAQPSQWQRTFLFTPVVLQLWGFACANETLLVQVESTPHTNTPMDDANRKMNPIDDGLARHQ